MTAPVLYRLVADPGLDLADPAAGKREHRYGNRLRSLRLLLVLVPGLRKPRRAQVMRADLIREQPFSNFLWLWLHFDGADRAVSFALRALTIQLSLSQCMYGTYIAANMLPRTWTLYPGATAVGLAASPLWVAQGLLVTHFAQVLSSSPRPFAEMHSTLSSCPWNSMELGESGPPRCTLPRRPHPLSLTQVISVVPKLFAAKRKEADLTSHVGLFNGIFGTFLLLVRPILSPSPSYSPLPPPFPFHSPSSPPISAPPS